LNGNNSIVTQPSREVLPRQFQIWEQAENPKRVSAEPLSAELPITVERKFCNLDIDAAQDL